MRPIYWFLWSPSLSRMNVWEISLDNDQWLAFKRTAAVLYKLFIGLFVSPIPSGQSLRSKGQLFMMSHRRSTQKHEYKEHKYQKSQKIYIVCCDLSLYYLYGELIATEIQMPIQRSTSTVQMSTTNKSCKLSVLFNLPSAIVSICSCWQISSSKQVKGHWQKIVEWQFQHFLHGMYQQSKHLWLKGEFWLRTS